MIKVIIIDDEEQSRRVLQNLIAAFHSDIEIVALCASVPDAVLQINTHQPDVVFCDIEMPQYSGLELVSFFKEVNFELIFATGHSEYAIQAFEMSAVDYLLKPIHLDKLNLAIEKVKQKLKSATMYERLQTLKLNLADKVIHNIALPVSDGLAFIELKKIILFEADGAYTKVWQKNGDCLLISKNLKFFESLVKNHIQFYKIHRSAIVNINFIQKYSRKEGYLTLLHDQHTKIARGKKANFEDYISSLNL